MKKRVISKKHIFIVFLLLVLSPQLYASDFFVSLPDVPLMYGIVELEEQALNYDSPHGRVTEVYASLEKQGSQEVLSYYGDVLPQFGWVRLAPNQFQREREKMSLIFEGAEGEQILRIQITPN